jgi:hypothetical protein
MLCGIDLTFGGCGACLKCHDPLAETGLYAVGVGDRQGVFDRKAFVNPVCSLIRRLKLNEARDQLVAQSG